MVFEQLFQVRDCFLSSIDSLSHRCGWWTIIRKFAAQLGVQQYAS